MIARATALHQDVVLNLAVILKNISKTKERCLPRIAPFDLKLVVDKQTSVVQPDIMLFCDGDLPCAVFEVLSPSTAYRDKTVKKELYEKSGIREYFLINVEYKIVEKFMIIEDRYQYIGTYGMKDKIRIDCLDDKIEVAEVFDI
jgi:Uma2 family endonuclease